MALYRYVKAPPRHLISASPASLLPTSLRLYPHNFSLPSITLPHFLPSILMTLGALIIVSIATPIVYHELVTFPRLRKVTIISPIPNNTNEIQNLASVAGVTSFLNTTQDYPTDQTDPAAAVDYTKASNWFPTAPIAQPNDSKITHYTIDIPTLDISNAVVGIGGEDLEENLIQYPQTANPGELGSPVIFGHSVLRQFYNPTEINPNRYTSIFSTIMTLKDGEEIYVNFDGIKYTYKVSDKYEVNPEQIEVLRQQYDRQTLKLITCTPEGTYLRRGVIEAQLIKTN